jgi:hypothetical protein
MKKKTGIEYFETKKYYCWLTGFGSPRWCQKMATKPVDQVKDYLKREKKQRDE